MHLLSALLVSGSISYAAAGSAVAHLHPRLRSEAVDATFSHNTSSCPGYTLSGLKTSKNGLTAKLDLAGPACNAYGTDIANLTLNVVYQSKNRLRVNIHDTDNKQFTLPKEVIELPSADDSSTSKNSNLKFNFQNNPFEFWITRNSADPSDEPLFDTRKASIPAAPIAPSNTADVETGIDSTGMVFENLYLQMTSALPKGTNIYGLGEYISGSGFRRAIDGNGTLQTMWNRDDGNPVDGNVYGTHPFYIEHRYNSTTNKSKSHGVLMLSAAGQDVLLQTPGGTPDKSLIQWRLIGGVFDMYFFSGPTPKSVVSQYGQAIGLPAWLPAWGFGYHQCRWGYANVSETREQVTNLRAANIPQEVQWNDIDIYQAYRDFTLDKIQFPGDEVRDFLRELKSNNQRYIPIVDAAIAKQIPNGTDRYDTYLRGIEQDVFVKNPDGSEYIGQVWPGYTDFPDWFAPNTQSFWTEAHKNWTEQGMEFSGIWLDVNEASSFCTGSCGTTANLSNTSTPFILPGPLNPVLDYPEGYNSTISGPSGNITVNGTLTFMTPNNTAVAKRELPHFSKRGVGTGSMNLGDFINEPPYAIHNTNFGPPIINGTNIGPLGHNTIATNATHHGGFAELDVHNLWGHMEEITTHRTVQALIPGQRPFLISRSTFVSGGKWTGHWTGDNNSKWYSMYLAIQGILQFQIFQIPMVGSDTCGFNGNTDEELCNRWMQMSAFHPFYRNHNIKTALPQEPYRWDSVANATRIASGARYSLLPYWLTLFANASLHGSPPVRALFMEFPNEPELFGVDRQFMVGKELLVTPVLQPNVSTVDGILPGQGRVTWRDWWSHEVVHGNFGVNTTFAAPLSHINVHLRDGSALLLHQKPGLTITETRAGPYSALVSLKNDTTAFGTAYVDDAISSPPGPSRILKFNVAKGKLNITSTGSFTIEQKLDQVTILGIPSKPTKVVFQGVSLKGWTYKSSTQELDVTDLNASLNSAATMTWT